MLVLKDYVTSIQILSSTFFLHSGPFQIHHLHAVYLPPDWTLHPTFLQPEQGGMWTFCLIKNLRSICPVLWKPHFILLIEFHFAVFLFYSNLFHSVFII